MKGKMYYTSLFDEKNLSPIQLLNHMFEESGFEEILLLEDCPIGGNKQRCKIVWEETLFDDLVREFRELCIVMHRIARVYRNKKEKNAIIPELLVNMEEIAVWSIYLSPFQTDIYEQQTQEAETRVGSGIYAYELVMYAMRLFKLVMQGASNSALWETGRWLAVSMALHWHGHICDSFDS